MGIGSAIVGGVMSLQAAQQQKRAGRDARNAAEENAISIENETQNNILQLERSQGQTLGMAKAIAASSGIKFDARNIDSVEFSKGGVKNEKVLAGYYGAEGDELGDYGQPSVFDQNNEEGTREAFYKDEEVEQSYGDQLSGQLLGNSAFTYLKEMKRNFARDVGFASKQGRARAKVTRMGGKVAQAQANAGATSSYAAAFGSFGTAAERMP